MNIQDKFDISYKTEIVEKERRSRPEKFNPEALEKFHVGTKVSLRRANFLHELEPGSNGIVTEILNKNYFTDKDVEVEFEWSNKIRYGTVHVPLPLSELVRI